MVTTSILLRHVLRQARPSAAFRWTRGAAGAWTARRHASTAPKSSSLAQLSQQDVEHFATILPKTSILSTIPPFDSTADDLKPFNSDWMDKYHGHSTCVLKPRSAKEVSEILRYCWERRIAVVPQGGNTGLVGTF